MSETDCPKCGCNDTKPTGDTSSWGTPAHGRRCNHCGARFTVPDDVDDYPSVPFVPTLCPRCGSDRNRVHTTRRPVRYHRCNECHLNFRSIETAPPRLADATIRHPRPTP